MPKEALKTKMLRAAGPEMASEGSSQVICMTPVIIVETRRWLQRGSVHRSPQAEGKFQGYRFPENSGNSDQQLCPSILVHVKAVTEPNKLCLICAPRRNTHCGFSKHLLLKSLHSGRDKLLRRKEALKTGGWKGHCTLTGRLPGI